MPTPPRPPTYPVPGAQNLSGTAGSNPDAFTYSGSSVVNTTGGGGGGFHVPFLPFGFGSGGSTPPADTPWTGNAGQPQPAPPSFLSRLFGSVAHAIPGALGSVAHLGSLGIGSLLNRHGAPGAPSAPSFPTFGAGFAPISGEHTIAGGGTVSGIDPRTSQPIYNALGSGQFQPTVSSAGTPNQLAANAQTAFQTGFMNMQDSAWQRFFRPDQRTPDGVFRLTTDHPQGAPGTVGNTLANVIAYNAAYKGTAPKQTGRVGAAVAAASKPPGK